ncbi:MAG: RraA family protein [Rhodothermia bacterium]|nr:MAG: RraA family protein [Rhodothermia bacterium]
MKNESKAGTGLTHPGPGCRIQEVDTRPPAQLLHHLGLFDTADISDQLNGLYAMQAGFYNVVNRDRITGPACTVRVYPGDNLMVHKALDIAQPGDIIVVDTGGTTVSATIGGLMATKARHRGIAGFVIDGFVRDVEEMTEVGLPVYARGATPVGPLHRGPGEINFPISCGGIVVNAGDVICADDNGIVVVPQNWGERVLKRLNEWKKLSENYIQDVRRGEFSNEWVDQEIDNLKLDGQ